MQITRLTLLVQHEDAVPGQLVADTISVALRPPSHCWGTWTVGPVTVDEREPGGGAPEPGPGWHITTCGRCGGEATHEDNCKNDS